MNTITAYEPEAQDLLALARPGGDAAAMIPGGDAAAMIAAAPRHARHQLTLALMGVG